jgi:hypothetical protein
LKDLVEGLEKAVNDEAGKGRRERVPLRESVFLEEAADGSVW